MLAPPARPWLARVLVAAVAVVLIGTACSTGYAQPAPGNLPGVDLSRLEPDEKKTFFEIINAEPCSCGEAHSLAVCVASHKTCRRSQYAVRMVFRRLRQGFPKDEILAELVERYRAKKPVAIDISLAPRKGSVNAPVTVIEFSDFECPACKKTAPLLAKVLEQMGTKVKLYYKNYPLRSHPHAMGAAQAAVAAKKQGKFWAMHDKLFANQNSLNVEDLIRYAGELGLDLARFKEDLNSPETKALVAKDRAEGDKLNLRGTPTIYINGKLYLGPLDLEELKAAVEEEP
jgi:protein-disulfide isomerase